MIPRRGHDTKVTNPKKVDAARTRASTQEVPKGKSLISESRDEHLETERDDANDLLTRLRFTVSYSSKDVMRRKLLFCIAFMAVFSSIFSRTCVSLEEGAAAAPRSQLVQGEDEMELRNARRQSDAALQRVPLLTEQPPCSC